MRTLGRFAVALGLVALMAAPAMAQGRGGGFMGGGAALLANKSVQQEIKASDDQVSKMNALAEDLRGKAQQAFQGFQDLSDDERRTKMQEFQRTLQADIDKGLKDVLKTDQIKRFHQISTQQAGVNAFNTPRVAEALKLSDDQKAKIREIAQETMQSMRDLRGEFQNDREGAMKKMAELRKSSTEKAVAVLTADQRATWKDLTGEPFEVKFERPNN